MKSPQELSNKLSRKWRESRQRVDLLLNKDSWPISLNIGKPSSKEIESNTKTVREHFKNWNGIKIGEVFWEEIKYRSISGPIKVPVRWHIEKPTDWIRAIDDKDVTKEFCHLSNIISSVDELFHHLLVRQVNLHVDKPEYEVIKTCELALELEPGCARGAPLRSLSYLRADSKFYERNRTLITKLLDIRFNGVVSGLGLEEFLGAINENNHWILLADLTQNNLPFKNIRIRSSDLPSTSLSVDHILIIENESCLYHLPQLDNTIAILGSGLNLSWMKADWLKSKKVAYWGDIDTWGLMMLARARQDLPSITPLLMNKHIFDKYAPENAVVEPTKAGDTPPFDLSLEEKNLYIQINKEKMGRLEQEFIPKEIVVHEILEWHRL